jgi:hypothetical protein
VISWFQAFAFKFNLYRYAGVRGKGNFVVGWMYAEIELMAVKGAVVYVDEVVNPADTTKKIRNFQNIRRQSPAAAAAEREAEEAAMAAAAGLYKLNLVATHSLKPPGVNPCAWQVRNWFQILLFQIQLVSLHRGGGEARGGRGGGGARGGRLYKLHPVDPLA